MKNGINLNQNQLKTPKELLFFGILLSKPIKNKAHEL